MQAALTYGSGVATVFLCLCLPICVLCLFAPHGSEQTLMLWFLMPFILGTVAAGLYWLGSRVFRCYDTYSAFSLGVFTAIAQLILIILALVTSNLLPYALAYAVVCLVALSLPFMYFLFPLSAGRHG